MTFERRADGYKWSGHAPGLLGNALRLLLTLHDPREWRVLSVSTPQTILRDVRGRNDGRGPEWNMAGQVPELAEFLR